MLFRTLLAPCAAAGVLALTCAGCLQPADLPDAEPRPHDASVDAPAAPPVDASTTPCANSGAGRLRVSVSLAPALASRTADVWLAVVCGDDPRPVRLVRWDGSPTQTLEGFGPGAWRVYGSTFLSPGAWSTTATLGGVSTAAVSLTLDGDGALLAQVGAGQGDAGAPADTADAGDDDGSSEGAAWSARVPMRDSTGGPALGWASLTARPLDATSIEVQITVQNLCSQPPCAPFTLDSVEARAAEGNTPVGFARGVFANPALQYGATTMTMPHLVLRGALPDAAHSLQVAVYSTAPAPRANARARTP